MLAGMMVLLGLFGALFGISKYRAVTAENRAGEQSITELRTELAELKKKGELVRESLTPQQQELMIAGHKLVANKEFGWSRLLFDIERVLPNDVSASRIGVENVYKEGNSVTAELEFGVLSRNYTSVLNMIQRMNNSGIFRASLRGQDLQDADKQQYTEYTMLLTYRPGAGVSSDPDVNESSDSKPGGEIADAR
jgi:Tfp pilus assembly protein PilN